MDTTRDRSNRRRVLAILAVSIMTVLGLPSMSQGATTTVTIRDNRFLPQEVHIDPGDSIVWTNQGARVHDVKSDTAGQFRSGDMEPGDTYTHRFEQEGYYYYHCTYHGASGHVGMWGVIIVGNPPPPEEEEGEKDDRTKLVVPDDFPTIQKAVNAANPGTTILIRRGAYNEAVVVKTPHLVIKGEDRFQTILDGKDKKTNGITVDGTHHVSVVNLTVRNYLGNGIFFNNSRHYSANRIDSIKNRTYGLYAFNSYYGVFKNSFGYGSGDSAFYVGQCLGCGALLENIKSVRNYLGYSGTNATGVVIRDSVFAHNGAGIVPNTLPTEELAPNRGTLMIDNIVRDNNYETIPAAGFSETVGIPFGTGIWMAGTENNIAKHNTIFNHKRYGVLITPSIDADSIPKNNRVYGNIITDSGMYDLAFDGGGENNCYARNDFSTSGPPEIETLYHCAARPFANAAYGPVGADVAASLGSSQTREQIEPPEPKRPKCQPGKPWCG